MMLEESFFNLLSLRMRTERLGHRSKSSNYVSLLKDKAKMSSFSDHGASVKQASLFSLSSSTTILFAWEKDPFSILSTPFLFKVKISNFEQFWNVDALISDTLFDEASTFLSPSPSRGSPFILLSLMIKCSRVLMGERFGRLVRLFSDILSSTKAGQYDI